LNNDSSRGYKLEVWVTAICFFIVAVTGGFFSSVVVIMNEAFFNQVPTPDALVAAYGETMFVFKEHLAVWGFPLHYFLLVVLSWIGATLVGAIWCLVMDRLEEKQRA